MNPILLSFLLLLPAQKIPLPGSGKPASGVYGTITIRQTTPPTATSATIQPLLNGEPTNAARITIYKLPTSGQLVALVEFTAPGAEDVAVYWK